MQERAERLLGSPASLGALALAFDESAASSAEVLVEGALVLPADARRHRRRLVLGAHQPVRLPAGHVGDVFAEALIAKAAEGVPSGWSSTGRLRSRGRLASSTTGSRPAVCRSAW